MAARLSRALRKVVSVIAVVSGTWLMLPLAMALPALTLLSVLYLMQAVDEYMPLFIALYFGKGLDPSGMALLVSAASATAGLCLLTAGSALWGWRRRYIIFGVSLVVSAALATAAYLAVEGVILWEAPAGFEKWQSASRLLLIIAATELVLLTPGILLIRKHRRLDRLTPAPDMAQGRVPDKRTESSKLRLKCPNCGRRLRGATTNMVGDTAVCPSCKAEFEIRAE